jgi:crotonobetainyl-CoA:carnitine CoA-transferase CaiB-like acyl-CoA transferase
MTNDPPLAEAPLVSRGALAGLRVIDAATVIAGPGCARHLADFGADVIKVERPGGDTTRTMGLTDPADGVSLYFKLLNRGKRSVVLDLKTEEGRRTMLALCEDAHVLVENFRPGTLERLGLGPDVLLDRNPGLVITRVTGFGQEGPYASRAGFATIAEAMSGFAAINGAPDGPPLLPPIAIADELTAIAAAFATMVALHSGVGQVVDVNLLESLLQCMGFLPAAYHSLGYEQPRLGSGIPYTVPRGTWRCADGRWVAISTSSESVARRVMDLLGRGSEDRFRTSGGRVANRDEIDALMAEWCEARPLQEVLDVFEEANAAAGPVYTMADVAADEHIKVREAMMDVGGVRMQGLLARLSCTPGSVRSPAPALGGDTAEWSH